MKEVFGPVTGFKILEGPEGAPKRLDTKIDKNGIEVATLNGFRWDKTTYPFEQIESTIDNGKLILILSDARYVLQARKPERLVAKIEEFKQQISLTKTSNIEKKQPITRQKVYQAFFGFIVFIVVIAVIMAVFEPQIKKASEKLEKQTAETNARLAKEEETRNKPETVAYDAALKAFGEISHENGSGIVGFTYSEEKIIIDYRFFPLGALSISDEIGHELAPKIKKFYSDLLEADEIQIYITLPYDDKLGNRTWQQSFILDFDRAIYQAIKWDNFDPNNLVHVARGFQVLN